MNKKYFIYSAVILITLLVFVFINEKKGDYYSLSVEDAHSLLTGEDISISSAEVKAAGTDFLFIEVVSEGEMTEVGHTVVIPANQLLNRSFLRLLKKHEGIWVIDSEDAGLATQAWVILTRKGYKGIKILDMKKDEMLRYTFVPESE